MSTRTSDIPEFIGELPADSDVIVYVPSVATTKKLRRAGVASFQGSEGAPGTPGTPGTPGASAPFVDSEPLVKGSADVTKFLRFEIDGFTAGVTRVLTPPNQDITLAGLEVAQTFSAANVFSNSVFTVGASANANNLLSIAKPAAAGMATLHFDSTDLLNNFIRKYTDTPFQIELASSVGIDLVLDSNNNETGATFRILTNATRGGAQTTVFTVTDNGLVTVTGKISNLTDPTLAQDAATKAYVDAAVGAFELGIAISDETTAIAAGTTKVTFRMPDAITLTGVRASLTTASSSGIVTVDINESGSTILSTKLTIDANEKTSTTAATPAVISDSSLADDAEITIDIDTAGTGAAGLKIWLIGTRT